MLGDIVSALRNILLHCIQVILDYWIGQFATNDHMVDGGEQAYYYSRTGRLKTKRPEPVKLDLPLF